MNIDIRKIWYFLAVKEILELYIEQEVGTTYEINIPLVWEYIDSSRFIADHFETNSKEEIYQSVTDDILAGYPVWRLFKLTPWTTKIMENQFAELCRQRDEELRSTYKCFTCKWFKELDMEIGTIYKCNRPKEEYRFKLKRDEREKVPKKQCKYYERKEEN